MCRSCLLALAICFTFSPLSRADDLLLRVGAYAIDVTPEKFPVIVNCSFNEVIGKSAQSKLHARCIVLEQGKERIAMVTVDSCMMPREFIDSTKKLITEMTGIPEDHQMISATHTHTAPAVMGCLGSDPDPVYPSFLQTQLIRGVAKAIELLQPAKVGNIVVDATKYTNNRRWILRTDKLRRDPFGDLTVRANMHPGYQNPDFIGPSGPIDPGLSVVAFRTMDDKPLAIWCNFSMHYFGTAPVSPDYCGLFAEKIAKKIAPDDAKFVPVMTQGTSGDLMWMDYAQPKPWTDLNNYAEGLATLVTEQWKNIQFSANASIGIEETKMKLMRRLPDEKRLKWARDIQAVQKTPKPQSQQEIYAREALMIHDQPERELKLQVIRVGTQLIVTIPNEVFAITGLRLKALSPWKSTCVVELANGSEGYIPPPEQHILGGYTTWPARSAGLELQAEPKIVEQLTSMMERVTKEKRRPFAEPEGDYSVAIEKLKPIAYWRFGQLTGMTIPGAELEPGFALGLDGPPSKAFAKDGVNRCMQFAGGRMKAKGVGETYTVECWVWNGFPTDVRPITGAVFVRGGNRLVIGGKDNSPGVLIFDAGKEPLSGKTPLELRRWYHVVAVRKGTKIAVYLNGQKEIDGEMPSTPNADFVFGELEGRLDELAIYGEALAPDVIKQHYEMGR